jgi:hypothetical protein
MSAAGTGRAGRFVLLVLFGVATFVIAFDGLMAREHRHLSLGLFVVGLAGTCRQYLKLRTGR